MAGELRRRRDETATADGAAVANLVRAIRRAHLSPSGYGGLERFTVTDIFDFARRLVAEGVLAPEGDS